MYTVDRNMLDMVLESNASDSDKIDALKTVKESIKCHRFNEAKRSGKVAIASALMTGALCSIDSTVINSFVNEDIVAFSNANLGMFAAECSTGAISLFGALLVLLTFERYVYDVHEVKYYQKTLNSRR